jgi:hypothetical protein
VRDVVAARDLAKWLAVKLGRKPKLTEHQKREAIGRRDRAEFCNSSLVEVCGLSVAAPPPIGPGVGFVDATGFAHRFLDAFA